MELKGSGGSFKKFEKVGDSIEGRFVSFGMRMSPWGEKPEVKLEDGDGNEFTVSTPTTLANIIKENLDLLKEGQPVIRMTWTGSAPSKKGNPVKLFKVDTVE